MEKTEQYFLKLFRAIYIPRAKGATHPTQLCRTYRKYTWLSLFQSAGSAITCMRNESTTHITKHIFPDLLEQLY